MGLRAGDLRSRIEFVRAVTAINRGEPIVERWDVITTVWAQVVGLNGREAVIARVLEGISVYRIAIRWRRDLLQSDQIRLSGSVDLNIKSISDPDGRREQLLIIADTDGAQKTT